jgi:predicted acyl esterase
MTDATVRAPLPEGIVLEENVPVVMRDGVRLAADVYRPEAEGTYPGILSMSPYIKEIQQWPPAISHSIEAGKTPFFVSNGYVHVIVTVRGAGISQGRWSPWDVEQQKDGYELVEWIAAQPWCNGSVTMLGDSYFAMMQWLVALQKPPHLKCIAPVDASTDFYRDYAWKGGLFNTSFLGMWAPDTIAQCLWPGPVEGKQPPSSFLNDFLSHPEDGPFWWEISSWTRIDQIETPVMSIVPQPSYNHSRGQLAAYPRIMSTKKLVVLPWNPQSHVVFMESPPLNEHILRWFDHWCKGIDTGILDEPEVAICDSVTGEWRYEAGYPIERTEWRDYYFRSSPAAPATEPPFGVLSTEPPGDEAPDSYPAGSRLPHTGDMSHDPMTPPGTAKIIQGMPQAAFMTEQLGEELRISGPISAILWAATDTVDAAFFVKVGDVDPDGNRRIISENVLKASHREIDAERSQPGLPFHPHQDPVRPEAGLVYEYQIELPPKFWTFRRGHRIWFQVSSDENAYHGMLHTVYTSELLPAPGEVILYHDRDHRSRLVLPVVAGESGLGPVAPPLGNVVWPPVSG